MAEPLYWPGGLPQLPSSSSYARATGNNTIRSTMEFGPAKTRRRSTAQPAIITATYLLLEDHPYNNSTVNQKELFASFYEVVDCHMSFWLPDPEDQSRYILVKIQASGNEKGVSIAYRSPRVWTLSVTLEVHQLVPSKVR